MSIQVMLLRKKSLLMHKILIPIFLLLFTTLSTSSSDLPVPRWVSLKGDANLRKGPFPEATIIYRYQLKGYPMEIIRDIEGWRQVRDPKDGVTGWMSHILFSGKRYALTSKKPFSYGYDKSNKNKILAKIDPFVHAKINKCDSSWCKITIIDDEKEIKVWIEKSNLLGVYPHEIIN